VVVNGVPTIVRGGGSNLPPTELYTLALSQPLFRWDRWQTYQQSKLAAGDCRSPVRAGPARPDHARGAGLFRRAVAQDTLESTRAQKAP
jgi:outer membrane protein